MKLKTLLLAALTAISLSGCISAKSYVDPSFAKATYDDLKRRPDPAKWQVKAEFQRNGAHLERGDTTVKDQVERVLRASGIAVPTSDAAAPTLKVVVNNVADVGAAAGKGFGTGLTFGLVGSTVTDGYVMDVTLVVNGKEIRAQEYKHAIHTTIGNTQGPAGLAPMTTMEAVNKVIEQMLLNALKDIERQEMPATASGTWFDSVANLVALNR